MSSAGPDSQSSRRAAPFGLGLVLLGVAAAVSFGSVGAMSSRPAGYSAVVGFVVGGAAGFLAILALPSVPSRWSALAVLAAGGIVVIRFVGRYGVDPPLLVLWGAAAVALLVLSDRLELDGQEAADPPAARAGPRADARWLASSLRTMALAGIAVAILAALLLPLFERDAGASSLGGGVSNASVGQASTTMRATSELDMTQRPRLSDAVVMTVKADEPAFWRGQIFDTWDGRTWTRSNTSIRVVTSGGAGRVRPDPSDPLASQGEELVQEFNVRDAFTNLVFAAPQPVQVTSKAPVVQQVDGSLVSGGAGTGSSYSVTSRRVPVTAESLAQAEGQVPEPIEGQYAQRPETSARVVALAKRITAGETTTYGKVQAIERWMGQNTTYSLDAPLSPVGVDVVDHFLFTSKQGWCEQIASSEVVLLRAVGVPARLATGFVPGQLDRLTGDFTVRERDAHAWTEVYIGGIGWQDFDPTASVPLAGEATKGFSLYGWLSSHRVLVIGLAVLLFAAVAALPALRRRSRRDGAARAPRRRRRSWAATQVARLEQVGRVRASRARAPSETPSAYAAALAELLGEPRLRQVGATLDASIYNERAVAPDDRSFVDTTLGELKPSAAERGRGHLHRRPG